MRMGREFKSPSKRRGLPKIRDRLVLTLLVLISSYLLLDSLIHLLPPTFLGRVTQFLHSRSDVPYRMVLFFAQLACCIYVWHRFRSEVKVRNERDEVLRQRADEMTQFHSILESLPTRISIQSPDFKVLYQNPAHHRVIGHHVGEFCYEAYSEKDQVCDNCPLSKTYADGKIHVLNKTRKINGENRSYELITAPLKKADGTIVAGIEVVTDNTDQARFEEHIISLSRRLEESNRELRSFSSALAHDLRQPLTRTYMAAQVLDDQTGIKDDQFRSLISVLLDGCEQMEEMVDGMLTLCRVDQEEMKLEPFDLSETVEEIILNLRALDPKREVKLTMPRSLEVNSDKRLLRILLQNLLGNAWKYSDENAPVEIAITRRHLGSELQLSVRDKGIGFSMEAIDDLFRPFKRLHSDHNVPGTGIGLATARRVVHRLGGSIWATSCPGEGSEFFFTLPIRNVIPGS